MGRHDTTDLQPINERAVHRQMDAMGIRAAIRAGTEMQQLATLTATARVRASSSIEQGIGRTAINPPS